MHQMRSFPEHPRPSQEPKGTEWLKPLSPNINVVHNSTMENFIASPKSGPTKTQSWVHFALHNRIAHWWYLWQVITLPRPNWEKNWEELSTVTRGRCNHSPCWELSGTTGIVFPSEYQFNSYPNTYWANRYHQLRQVVRGCVYLGVRIIVEPCYRIIIISWRFIILVGRCVRDSCKKTEQGTQAFQLNSDQHLRLAAATRAPMSAKQSNRMTCAEALWGQLHHGLTVVAHSAKAKSLSWQTEERLIGRHLPPPANSSQLTILGSRDDTSGGSRLCLSAGGSWCCLCLGKKRTEVTLMRKICHWSSEEQGHRAKAWATHTTHTRASSSSVHLVLAFNKEQNYHRNETADDTVINTSAVTNFTRGHFTALLYPHPLKRAEATAKPDTPRKYCPGTESQECCNYRRVRWVCLLII